MQVDFLLSWLAGNPELGWVAVVLYLMWEIRGPKGKINDLSKRLKSIIVVVRALAQVHKDIDTEQVDDYLVENGSQPSDFIHGEDPRGYDPEQLKKSNTSSREERRRSNDDD